MKHEEYTVEAGKRIRDYDCINSLDDAVHTLIYVNGFIKDADYVLKENDIATVRYYASGTQSSGEVAWGVLNLFTFGIPSIVNCIQTGNGRNGKAGFRDKFISWFESDTDSAVNGKDAGKTESIPSVSGAKNTSQYGKAYPFVMGRHLFSPRYIGTPYTQISGVDGEDEHLTVLYLLGYSPITARRFRLGTVEIASNKENIENGKIVIDCDRKYGIMQYEPELEISDSGEVSLYPCKVYQEKLNLELKNITDDADDKWVFVANRFSQKYPKKVQVEFELNGLFDSSSGSMRDRQVAVAVEYSKDGGTTWLPFGQIGVQNVNGTEERQSGIDYYPNGNTEASINGFICKVGEVKSSQGTSVYNGVSVITRAKNKQMRFVAEHEFSYGDVMDSDGKCTLTNSVIELRIVRTNSSSVGDDASSIAETIELSKIRTWCFDRTASASSGSLVDQSPMIAKDRVRTTRLGFRIKASPDLKGQTDSLNCILTSKGRVWDSVNKEWKVDADGNPIYEETQNPASIALLALQSEMRGQYKYSDDMIDLESFGRFYEWCAEKGYYDSFPELERFQCNGILTSQKKTSEVLSNILNCGRGYLVLNGKKYGVLIDKPRTEPVLILNSQNVLSASNTKSFDELPDGMSVKFINEDNDYNEDEAVVLVDYEQHGIEDDDLKLEDASLVWQTNWQQVWSNIRYRLACKKLRPEVWKRTVTTEGNLVELGDLVEVQDDTILVGIGEGAEITSVIIEGNYIIGIATDGNFTISDGSKEYGVKITQADGIHAPRVRKAKVVNNGVGEYSTLMFDSPVSLDDEVLPSIGDNVSFGEYGKETILALVFGKSPDEEGRFDLTLLPYDERIYTADKTETLPDFDSKVTVPVEISTDNREDVLKSVQRTIAENASEVVKKTETLQQEIDSMSAPDAIRIDASANFIQFHKRIDGSANYEVAEIIARFMVNGTLTAPDSVSVDTSASGGVSVTFDSAENVYTFKFTSTYGESVPHGNVKLQFMYNRSIFIHTVNIEATSDTNYLGGKYLDEIPQSANIGDYFVYKGVKEGEDASSYEVSCVYIAEQIIVEDEPVLIWVLDESPEHCSTALSDIVSCVDISNNTTALLLVQRIVSNKASIESLFSNKIEVGKYIESNFTEAEYDEYGHVISTGTGFRLSKDGTLNTNVIIINGMSISALSKDNLRIGYCAMTENVTGSNNLAIGSGALRHLISGEDNIAIGRDTLYNNVSGWDNVAIGIDSLETNVKGSSNIALGYSSLSSNKVCSYNIAIGQNSLHSLGVDDKETDSKYNTHNVSIGNLSMNLLKEGYYNVAIGYNNMSKGTAFRDNISIGSLNMQSTGLSGSGYNIAIGVDNGASLTTGKNNIIIGTYGATNLTTGSMNICIGDNVSVSTANAQNEINIGNKIFVTNGVLYLGSNWQEKSKVLTASNLVNNLPTESPYILKSTTHKSVSFTVSGSTLKITTT